MISLSSSIEIEVPAAELFAFVSEFENNSAWQSGVEAAEWTSPRSLEVGSTYSQRMEYRDLITTYEVTAFTPGHSVTTETRSGATMPTSVTRTVEPVNDAASRITVTLVVRPRGWRRLIGPMLKGVISKSIETDYRRLKRVLEGDVDG